MSYWAVASLALVMALVLLLPFSIKRVEEELEIFLLTMGCAAMTVSDPWNWRMMKESLGEPANIPNIISAARLGIKRREWAGAALLLIYFLALSAIY